MREDYFERVAKSATTMLSRWDGSSALVRELTVSLRSLRIVLFADRASMGRRNILVAADPLWMSGPFAWEGSKLRVEVVASPPPGVDADGRLFRLCDPIGFELLTGSLEVKENVSLD